MDSVQTTSAVPVVRRAGLLPVIIAFGCLLTLGVFSGLLGVAWPSMRVTFGVPLEALGVFVIIEMAGYIVSGVVGGRLIGRFGVAPLLIGATVLRIGALGLAIATPLWLLFLITGFVYGIGGGLMDSAINTFAATYFRPRVLTWMHASFGIGTTSGSLLMTALLVAGGGWQIGLGVVLVLHIMLAIAYLLTRHMWHLDRAEPEQTVGQPLQPRVAPLRSTLALPIVLASIAVFFLYTGVEVGIGNWGFTLLTESRNVPAQAAGLAMTLFWASLTTGRILFAFIELRLVQMVRLSLVGVLAGTLMLALPVAPYLAWVGLLVAGLSLAPIFPTLITLTPRRTGQRHAPNTIGFEIAAAGLGAGVLSATAGRLGTLYGLESMAVFFVAAAVLLLVLHELVIRLSPSRDLPATG